jgi:hypothetical protein
MLKNEIKKDEAEKIYLELEKKGETLFTREIDGLICELHIYLDKRGEKDQAIRLLTAWIDLALAWTTDLKELVEFFGEEFDDRKLQVPIAYSHPDGIIEIQGRIFKKNRIK